MNKDTTHLAVDPAILDAFEAKLSPKRVAEGTYADNNDIMLFVHIPKTAGVSLGKSFQDAFDSFLGVDWKDPRGSFQKLTSKALNTRMQEPQRQVIAGHFGWHELIIWRRHELPIKAISTIRDPFERFVSNYNYNCSDKHPGNAEFRAKFPTLKDYAISLPTDFQLRQMIGLFYSFDHALEKLTRYYSFIGVTEKLDASLRWLSRSHGLPDMTEHRMNTASKPREKTEYDPAVRRMVMRKSANDARLHQLLMSFY